MSEAQIRFWCVECDRPIRDIVESNAHSGRGHSLVMVPPTLVREMNALHAERDALKEELSTERFQHANANREWSWALSEKRKAEVERNHKAQMVEALEHQLGQAEAERDRLVKALEANGRIDSPLVAEQIGMK